MSGKAPTIDIANSEARHAFEALRELILSAGGRPVLVGGSVRDGFLQTSAKDLDIEVFGIAPGRLRELISSRFPTDLIGEAFGVLKLKGLPIDVSIPRRESKAGLGHRAFEVLSDPTMSYREAAERRDFTINAMGIDLATNQLLDPFEGATDLENCVLRHVSSKFVEDPLRVLRGMQFAARFELTAAAETVSLCRSMSDRVLTRERVVDEWSKLLLRGSKPSLGLRFLARTGWLDCYPELAVTVGCAQDPEWHPEGDVWTHIGCVLDAFAQARTGDRLDDWIVGLACLCHDLGKPSTSILQDGRIRSRGHEEAGVQPTRDLLERIGVQTGHIKMVVPLVRDHMKPAQLLHSGSSDAAVRRLARRVGRIDLLVRVASADHFGRPPRIEPFEAGPWLLERAERLTVAANAPQPILRGRHLIELGFEPGPEFGPFLDFCFEAQLDGVFKDLDGALDHARRAIKEHSPAARDLRSREAPAKN